MEAQKLTTELESGESVDLDTRVGGGVEITSDPLVEDTYQIDKHAGELQRDEIKQLAELAGLEVSE